MKDVGQAGEYLHSWNAPPAASLERVQLEDDSLRDGLQGAFVRRPSLEEKQAIIDRMVQAGVRFMMLGFPAVSQSELEQCRALVKHLDDRDYPSVPRFLSRALVEDLEPIVRLQEGTKRPVWADFWICASPLRRKVEDWSLEKMIDRVVTAGEYLNGKGVLFGVSIEDATRTPPKELEEIVVRSASCGGKVLTICDTVGESDPSGAAAVVEFIRDVLNRHRLTADLWWHGHNDRGLGVANALAAAKAGAIVISGAFLGLGERSGNTPLEQVIHALHVAGNRQFKLEALLPLCELLAQHTATKIADNAPLVGAQAFATCTGTHSAAVLRARELGLDFEDLVFSSVRASELGRGQEILIGPVSGSQNARYMLTQLGYEPTEANIAHLLRCAKARASWMTRDDIRAAMDKPSRE